MRGDYGFLSERWEGCKTIADLNGTSRRYRDIYVDVVDIRTSKKIGRMELSVALTKFS